MLIKPVISINIISHFPSGMIWTALDVNRYSLAQDLCERLKTLGSFATTLAEVKLICKTNPGCNVIQFKQYFQKEIAFGLLKCPIPLPKRLIPDSSEFEIHVYSDSKCKIKNS